ncbi:MAG: LytTR family transcriptional regulator DNA-binding domain-containing protein [Cyclobacteriaceae bacterium]
MNYFWICLIHAGLVTSIALVYFFLLETILKAYDQWTIGKEFLHVGFVLLIIGIGNFLIRDVIYNNPNNWSLGYLLEEIRNTFLVGMLIMIIFVPINYILRLQRNIHDSMNLKTLQNSLVEKDAFSTLAIKTQVNADDFELIPESLIMARADGNYMELFIDSKGKAEKLVKRMTLKEFEGQLAHLPFILKTHRAYLVNLQKVLATKGNAQGFQLKVNGLPEHVPVSRSMIATFKEKLNHLK